VAGGHRTTQPCRFQCHHGYAHGKATVEPFESPAYWQTDLLPEPLRHRGGHWNSHCFLTHEFIDAIANDRQPVNNLYEALAYTAPGIVAHESVLQGGELLKTPSFDR
jgi:hypothetical protein